MGPGGLNALNCSARAAFGATQQPLGGAGASLQLETTTITAIILAALKRKGHQNK